MRWALAAGATASLVLLLLLGLAGYARAAEPSTHVVHVEARQFAYSPGVIRVAQGSTVRLDLSAHDVTHGFLLEGHDVDLTLIPGKPLSAEIVAARPGRYRFYCNRTCGQLHPFMLGELIVEPNYPLYAGLGLLPLVAALGRARSPRRGVGLPDRSS